MKTKCTIGLLVVLINTIVLGGCSKEKTAHSASQTMPPAGSARDQRDRLQSPIRSFDFANFTYPAKPVYSNGLKSFTLTDGKHEGKDDYEPVYLSYLVYGDITGDGQEEALITLVLNVKGTAIPFVNYLYSVVDGKPTLLWAFQNGDRADNGLRQVYAENGLLVIERFSPIGKNGAFATQFSRTRFRWTGTQFEESGEAELLPNPTNNSSPVMEPYRRSDPQ